MVIKEVGKCCIDVASLHWHAEYICNGRKVQRERTRRTRPCHQQALTWVHRILEEIGVNSVASTSPKNLQTLSVRSEGGNGSGGVKRCLRTIICAPSAYATGSGVTKILYFTRNSKIMLYYMSGTYDSTATFGLISNSISSALKFDLEKPGRCATLATASTSKRSWPGHEARS